MTAPKTAMVLAAGFGTRMGALTADTPKPLLRSHGRTLLDLALDHCVTAGVVRAVVNLHYLGDQIRTHLAERTDLEIAFSDEQPQILETGGGIVHALPQLGADPFFVLNSDAVFAGPNPLEALAEAWDPTCMDALLHLVPKTEALAYTRAGDFFLTQNGTAPRRRGSAAEADYIYSGAQIVTPEAFENAPAGAFSMNLIWDRLLAEARLSAIAAPGPWVDVGTPEGLDLASQVLAADNLPGEGA